MQLAHLTLTLALALALSLALNLTRMIGIGRLLLRQVMRVVPHSFVTFNDASAGLNTAIGAAFLPVWIVWLGVQLQQITDQGGAYQVGPSGSGGTPASAVGTSGLSAGGIVEMETEMGEAAPQGGGDADGAGGSGAPPEEASGAIPSRA